MPEADSQTLPAKDQQQFKQVVKLYESKHYKKALKTADRILQSHPNHGETLSMKGLTLSVLDRKTEAYDYVKRGLTESKCKSHVCWHVYGLLHRADRNYEQAMKCYRQALTIDKNNLQVLRDLSQLQVQCMETDGLLHTRHKLLELKPGHKFNWMGFALAHHLAHNYSKALQVLVAFESLLDPADNAYEKSEFLMYRNMIMFESGDYDATLSHLEAIKDTTVDKVSWTETKAKCYRNMGKMEDAHEQYLALITLQPDHRDYILDYVNTAAGMQKHAQLKGWTDDISKEICDVVCEVLADVVEKVPESHVVHRLALDVAYGDNFKNKVTTWVQPFLKKTIPALFSALKSLYRCPEKVKTMGELFTSWEESLRTNHCFPEAPEDKQFPHAHVWSLMLLSAHNYRQDKYEDALTWIQKAIDHTPTVEMLYILKGRILKHMDRISEAHEAINRARILDTADKYLNTKAVKYLMRNNRVKEADHLVSVFGAPPDEPATNNTVEMQCTWYEIEEGDAYWRLGDVITALKKWLLVDKHFTDISEDQMDFHQYCLRKLTVRYYVQVLRWDKRAFGNTMYQKAAKRVVRGYIRLFDMMETGDDPESKVLNLLKEDAIDETKEEKKDGEAAEEKTKEEEKKKGNKHNKGKKGKNKKEEKKKEDDDDDDEEEETNKEFNIQVDTKNPLQAAVRFAEALHQYSPDDIEAHKLSFQLYIRRKKPLLALRHLIQVNRLNKDDNDKKDMMSTFKTFMEKNTDTASTKLTPIINEQLGKL